MKTQKMQKKSIENPFVYMVINYKKHSKASSLAKATKEKVVYPNSDTGRPLYQLLSVLVRPVLKKIMKILLYVFP